VKIHGELRPNLSAAKPTQVRPIDAHRASLELLPLMREFEPGGLPGIARRAGAARLARRGYDLCAPLERADSA
jgi:hypothetical protein